MIDAIGLAGGDEAHEDGGGLAAGFTVEQPVLASERDGRIAFLAGYSDVLISCWTHFRILAGVGSK